jgi:2-acylglycerol O-acyltransferase 2
VRAEGVIILQYWLKAVIAESLIASSNSNSDTEMHPLGLIKFAACCGIWMVGCFAAPVAAVLSCFGIHWASYILIAYYSFRFVFPAKYWPYFLDFMSLNDTPYCNQQRIVMDKGATLPKPDSKTMLALGPHGILTIGWQTLISSPEYRKLGFKWLVAEIMSLIPFLADINTWSNIVSCAKDNMIEIMESGENIALIPGGFEEATLYKRNHFRLYLKRRKGFIKYALKYGYCIQPCFVFGEEKTYWQLDMGSYFKKISLWLNHFKIPTTFFVGKFLFLPDNNIDIVVVVGKTIKIPTIDNPTKDEIKKYHTQYIEAIQDIFERHKICLGYPPDSVLEIE